MRDDGQLAVTVRADADKAARVRAKFADSALTCAAASPSCPGLSRASMMNCRK